MQIREPLPFERHEGCTCTAIAVERAKDGQVRSLTHEPDCPQPAIGGRKQAWALLDQINHAIKLAQHLPPWLEMDDIAGLIAAASELRQVLTDEIRSFEPECARCGMSFPRQRSTARYCSNACRQAADRERRRNA